MATFQIDCSVEALRRKVDECNKILDGKKFLDIFGPARVDPNVPIETTVEGLRDLVKEGKIGGIQLSEVRAETIKLAAKVANIEMVEAEISLWATDVFSNGVAEICGELGITVVSIDFARQFPWFLATTPITLGDSRLLGEYAKIKS